MKRISPWLILLILTPAVCQAYGYYGCGVRYSPYALSYRNSGLVSGYTNYTPYAFTYRHSGLVPGYGICEGSDFGYGVPVVRAGFRRAHRVASRPSRSSHRHAQIVPRPVEPDGVDVIRRHLLAKGIDAVDVSRILRVDNQLVSVDFRIEDRNLLIKYRDPEQVEALKAKETFKQKAYEKYRDNWMQIAAQHERNGGAVYYVEASDAETIVAALDSCPRLEIVPETEGQPVMYARN